MPTNHPLFNADELDFSTIDASEREFFTIQYKDASFENSIGVFGGRVYLWVSGLCDSFTAKLWIEGEPVIELNEETEEIASTTEEIEPYSIDYDFSPVELDSIKWQLIQYIHCLLYGGTDYAIAEMSSTTKNVGACLVPA